MNTSSLNEISGIETQSENCDNEEKKEEVKIQGFIVKSSLKHIDGMVSFNIQRDNTASGIQPIESMDVRSVVEVLVNDFLPDDIQAKLNDVTKAYQQACNDNKLSSFVLDFSNKELNDDNIPALLVFIEGLQGVQVPINFNMNEITSVGATALFAGLAGMNAMFTMVDISDNNIDDLCLKYVIDFAINNEHIQRITIGNNITNEGFAILQNRAKDIAPITLIDDSLSSRSRSQSKGTKRDRDDGDDNNDNADSIGNLTTSNKLRKNKSWKIYPDNISNFANGMIKKKNEVKEEIKRIDKELEMLEDVAIHDLNTDQQVEQAGISSNPILVSLFKYMMEDDNSNAIEQAFKDTIDKLKRKKEFDALKNDYSIDEMKPQMEITFVNHFVEFGNFDIRTFEIACSFFPRYWQAEKGRLEAEKGRLEEEKGRLEAEKRRLEAEKGRLEEKLSILERNQTEGRDECAGAELLRIKNIEVINPDGIDDSGLPSQTGNHIRITKSDRNDQSSQSTSINEDMEDINSLELIGSLTKMKYKLQSIRAEAKQTSKKDDALARIDEDLQSLMNSTFKKRTYTGIWKMNDFIMKLQNVNMHLVNMKKLELPVTYLGAIVLSSETEMRSKLDAFWSALNCLLYDGVSLNTDKEAKFADTLVKLSRNNKSVQSKDDDIDEKLQKQKEDVSKKSDDRLFIIELKVPGKFPKQKAITHRYEWGMTANDYNGILRSSHIITYMEHPVYDKKHCVVRQIRDYLLIQKLKYGLIWSFDMIIFCYIDDTKDGCPIILTDTLPSESNPLANYPNPLSSTLNVGSSLASSSSLSDLSHSSGSASGSASGSSSSLSGLSQDPKTWSLYQVVLRFALFVSSEDENRKLDSENYHKYMRKVEEKRANIKDNEEYNNHKKDDDDDDDSDDNSNNDSDKDPGLCFYDNQINTWNDEFELISYADIKDGTIIGQGRTGPCYRKLINGYDCVCKCLILNERRMELDNVYWIYPIKIKNELMREARTYKRLKELQNKHIPVFLAYEELMEGMIQVIITEYVGETLKGKSSLSKKQCQSAKKALDKIHKLGVLHGDIRLENLIISNKNKEEMMMIDFAFAKFKEEFQNEEDWKIAVKNEDGELLAVLPWSLDPSDENEDDREIDENEEDEIVSRKNDGNEMTIKMINDVKMENINKRLRSDDVDDVMEETRKRHLDNTTQMIE